MFLVKKKEYPLLFFVFFDQMCSYHATNAFDYIFLG
jgi:hypothetical protein